jgi:hypothetical protein
MLVSEIYFPRTKNRSLRPNLDQRSAAKGGLNDFSLVIYEKLMKLTKIQVANPPTTPVVTMTLLSGYCATGSVLPNGPRMIKQFLFVRLVRLIRT